MAGGGSSIRDNAEAHRYEIALDGALAGFLTYRDRDGARVLRHTEVFPEFEHHGFAGELARFALDDIRSRGLHVVPRCPFVASYIISHPEYEDLVTT